jgi:heat shock protein HtpX
MTVFVMIVGRILGGGQGMFIALIFAGGMNFFTWWYSDKIVLRMYNAHEVTESNEPVLFRIVENLCRKSGLPLPKIYIIPQDSPNAFATGRNPENSVVAVTDGLLNLLDEDELEGVVAHELSHIKNRDILVGTIAATMAGVIMMLANMAKWTAILGGFNRDDESGEGGSIIAVIAMAIIAPMAAMLIQMAVSRSREYLADSSASEMIGSSEGLARALEKLGYASGKIPMDARPETAHMFITNPLAGRKLTNLFSTHPPIDDRIAKLRNTKVTGKRSSVGQNRMNETGSNLWDKLR